MRITRKKRLDKRFKRTELINMWINKYTRAAAVAGFIIGALIGCALFAQKTSPNDLKQSINPVTIVSATTDKYTERGYARCFSPLVCIRDIGEEQGRSNESIMTMIRIAKKESICNTKYKITCIPDNGVSGIGVDPYAKNPKSSARGLFQITAGTWYSNDCVGDKYNIEDNIVCAYKILDGQGLYAWEVCHNGSAQCW